MPWAQRQACTLLRMTWTSQPLTEAFKPLKDALKRLTDVLKLPLCTNELPTDALKPPMGTNELPMRTHLRTTSQMRTLARRWKLQRVRESV